MHDDRGQLSEEVQRQSDSHLGRLELIWRCTECGYLQSRIETLPDECPNCGAEKESFVLVDED